MAQTYLIRVAATNMAAFILDTTDLSTARGASLVLLRAATWVARRVLCRALGDDAEPVTLRVGASEALFRIEVADKGAACRAAKAVHKALQGSKPHPIILKDGDKAYEDRLRRKFQGVLPEGSDDAVESRVEQGVMRQALRHATFVVAAIEESDEVFFSTAQEQALAATRWHQMRSPSLAVPDLPRTEAERRPPEMICEKDGIRPAVVQRRFRDRREEGPPYEVSLSVATRRRFGWRQKQKFYLDEIEEGLEEANSARFLGQSADGALAGHPLPRLINEFRRARNAFRADTDWLNGPEGEAISGRNWLSQSQFFRADGGLPNMAFDLSQITTCDEFGDLNGKMAVLYADGNGFGAIQRDILQAATDSACRAGRPHDGTVEGTLQAMDHLMRVYRRRLLADMLHEGFSSEYPVWVSEIEDGQGKKARLIRLETLIWGGDELLWVMPAWLGFRIVELLMAHVEGHCPRDVQNTDGNVIRQYAVTEPWTLAGNRLHVAAGLVFCSHKSPIVRVQELARRLADSTKAIDRSRSLMAVEVLESFDHLGNEPEKQRDRRCPPGISSRDLVLDGEHLTAFIQAFAKFKKADPPRRRLKTVLAGLHDGQPVEGLREQYLSGLSSDMRCQLTIAFGGMVKVVGNPIAVWVHLDQFWDYLEPDFDAEAETGS